MARAQSAERAELDGVLEELARVRGEVEALRAQLEQQERLASLGMVAGLIAHEFNNILTPVLAYTQMSAAKPGDVELARKAVERAGAGSERAAKIARSILGLVRRSEGVGGVGVFHVEQGGVEGVGGCDVRAVVEDTLLCVPERGGVTVSVEVEEGLRAGMDSAELQQVLMNLVLNARNATRGRSGNIRICGEIARGVVGARVGEVGSGAAPDHTDVWAQISVIDTGPGMPPERVGGMFAPFVRGIGAGGGGGGGAAVAEGTGLGMVVCKRLVEACGGWIGVESAAGRGTRVRVVVPGVE